MKIIDIQQECYPIEYEAVIDGDELLEVKAIVKGTSPKIFAKQLSEDSWELTFWHDTAFRKQTLKLNYCDLDSISTFFKILQYSCPIWKDSNRYFGELKEIK